MDPNLFTSWHAIIIALLPGAIAYVCKPDWPAPLKVVVSFVVCSMAATVELYLSGTLTAANFPSMMGQVSALVFGSYAAIWKRFDIVGKVENTGNV